jgi:phenylalanyl-tRNA synthetase beta chain
MRVPLSWLQEFVTWDCDLDTLAERLTLAGLEVGNIDRIGETWDCDKIVVGRVVQVQPHPNADRLVLVTVDFGADEAMEVVTGAPNLRVGDQGHKVVFAREGARLIDPYADELRYATLKRTKIRGVYSSGMVCSEKELGLSEEHTGILVLPEDAPVGMPFADYWGDTVLDMDLTPNLARCFSILGVARETAALCPSTEAAAAFHPTLPALQAEGPSIEGQVEIVIEDPDLCPRYSAALIRDVKIGPSPLWMQRRLLLAGQRPINNIVDITNYVMLELGQPLHAFDYDLLRPRADGGPPAIIVRRAHPGETMTTLDGQARTLDHEMLLITDGGGPVAVAGVMGGLESEVTEGTRHILLESANFDNISVRRTSAALRIPSEAAQRFGRGVDREGTLRALERAAELMRELAGGTVAQGMADAYPVPAETRELALTPAAVRRALGVSLSAQELADMLSSLGMSSQVIDADALHVRVTVPSFRMDVTITADLIEEVARVYGYDRLPTTLIDEQMPAQRQDCDLEIEERVREILVGCGLSEIITYSMTNLESVAALTPARTRPDKASYFRLANPLTREHEYLRQTLMNTSLDTVAANLRFVERVALFEIARVYLRREGQALPDEPRRLSLALAGPRVPASWQESSPPDFDFYDLKGIVEMVVARLGIGGVTYEPVDHPTFQPGRAAALRLGEREIGVLGIVHPGVREQFDLPERPVCLAELDLEALLEAVRPERTYALMSRMPTLHLDLALIIDQDVPSDAVAEAIREAGGSWLVDIELFDVYRGAQIGEGKKSLAYRLTFQAPDRTLTSEQANRQRDRIVQALREQFGAEMRG